MNPNWKVPVRIVLFLPIVASVGCAAVHARRDYERVGAEVERAIGHASMPDPEDPGLVDAAERELMSGGLTADEAVQLALINNPRATALLLRVGMARADVVQAGLWSNPTLGISFRFPDGGGVANFEASLAQNIADLWMIPARKRATQHDLDRTIVAVARELVTLAVDTKVAYFDAVAAQSVFAIARDNVSLTKQLLAITEARLEAGTIGSLDVNLAKGQALQAEVNQRTARLASASARRTLATLMGLTSSADSIELVDDLPAALDRPLSVDQYVEIALDARLDARAGRDAVEAAAARVEFELAKVIPNFQVGVSLERNERRGQPGRKVLADTARSSLANGQLTAPEIQSRGQRSLQNSQRIEAILGPTLSMTLPIFDQNQAQIAKARMVYLDSKAQLNAIERSIVQETRDAADRLATASDVARLFEHEVVPQANATLDLSEATYQAGQTTILNVIDAQRSLLETRRANVAARQGAAVALAELERTTGRPVSELFESSESLIQPTASMRPIEE